MDATPTLDPQGGKNTKNAKIMIAVFAGLTLIFFCGGSVLTGIAASGREADGVAAATLVTGPACCAIAGLLTAVLSMFALPTKPAPQLIAPIVAGLVAGVFGAASIVIFFTAIWPSL